jgi:hypothetical protein
MSVNVQIYDTPDGESLQKQQTFLDSMDSSLIQQSGYWSKIVSDISPDKPYIVNAELDGKIIGTCVIYLYEAEEGNILFSDPHAGSLGSAVIDNSYDQEKLFNILEEKLITLAEKNDCISLTLSSNPFVNESPVEEYFSYDYALYDRVHYIDLDEYFDEEGNVTLEEYNKRSNLSRNIQEGHESSLEIGLSDSKKDLKDWHEVHASHLKALGGEPIPYSLFENAYDLSLKHPYVEYLYVYDDEDVVGGGLYVLNDNIVDILMMSTSYDAMEKGANFLLTDWALKHFSKKDLDIFNWQASNPPEGGIVRFKEQWGSKEAPFGYFTKLLVGREEILDLGLDTIRNKYKWHYVVPYGIFENPDKTEFYKTDSEIFQPS